MPASARPANPAINENEENKILDKVRRFPDEMVQEVDSLRRGRREKPAQDRVDEPAGLLPGKCIRRKNKDHPSPQQRRPPGTQPRSDHVFGRHALADLVEIGGGTRIPPGFGRGHSELASYFMVN